MGNAFHKPLAMLDPVSFAIEAQLPELSYMALEAHQLRVLCLEHRFAQTPTQTLTPATSHLNNRRSI